MSAWRWYRTRFALRNSDMRELRRVRHVTFEQLSSAGYDVRIFDDCSTPLDLEEVVRGDLPENWKIPQPVLSPKVANLRDAMLFMDGSALLPDGRYCFSDIFHADPTWYKLRHFNPSRMLRIADPITTGDALIRRMDLRSAIKIPGRCISTRHGNTPSNFGHFVHDVLMRIYYEDLGVIVPGRDKVIAPAIVSPMQKTLFQMVFEGYEIVQVPPDVPLRVEELLLLANLCNVNSFNPAACAALAKRMRGLMALYAGKDKRKVCISRRDGKLAYGQENLGRDFANFEDYEVKVREFGYDVMQVSRINPKEQFALWANTTDMIGIHGAGMMNMIMMPSGGNYIEIAGASGPNRHTPCPNSTIRCAVAAGLRVCGISTTVDQHGRPMIDIGRLEAELSCMTS